MYRWSDTREHGFYCQGDNGNDDDDEGDTDEDGNNDINRNYSLSLFLWFPSIQRLFTRTTRR